MSTCLDTSDVLEISRSDLEDTEKRLSAISDDLCVPFYEEARTVEQKLLSLYKTVALCVRKEDDLDSVAAWWAAMTRICDDFAGKLNQLCKAHPYCGAEAFHDRVLDLRNRCQRLSEMHS